MTWKKCFKMSVVRQTGSAKGRQWQKMEVVAAVLGVVIVLG